MSESLTLSRKREMGPLRPAAALALAFLILLALAAATAPRLTPYSYEGLDVDRMLEPPSAAHWFGTDELGRDLATRVLYGARVSLAVGVFTGLLALGVGAAWGAASAYLGGRADAAMMRVVDVLYSIPTLLVLILATLFVGRSVAGIFLALGLVVWTDMARLVRGQTMQALAASYVEAAHASGAGAARILLRHVLPNVAGPVLVTLTFTIPTAILAESTLSFVGLGIAPPAASWGTLAASGWKYLVAAPHLILYPALAISATILAFNVLGDALRDALDPAGRTTP